MPKPPPNAQWLEQTLKVLETIGTAYGVEEVDIHPGPLSGVRSINVSWQINKQVSYISLALPNDEVHPHEYSNALEKMLYGEQT